MKFHGFQISSFLLLLLFYDGAAYFTAKVHRFKKCVSIQAINPIEPNEVSGILIGRNGTVFMNRDIPPVKPLNTLLVHGIFGIIQLRNSIGVVFIDKSSAAPLVGPHVRRVESIKIIIVGGLLGNVKDSHTCQMMVNFRRAFDRHSFYFSTNLTCFDVTKNTQQNMCVNKIHSGWKDCNEEFFWNYNLLKPLMTAKGDVATAAAKFILPISNMCVSNFSIGDVSAATSCDEGCSSGSLSPNTCANVSLVSRRSRHQQGLRCDLTPSLSFVCRL